MSIPSYEGNTYVGYFDISGFKEMMKNERKARSVLDKFYKTIYETIQEVTHQDPRSQTRINAVVVSDCAVLFLSRKDNRSDVDVDKIEGLPKMLEFIEKTNRRFIDHLYPFMTTCSIAYGDFEYVHRNELEYLTKNCMMGKSYLSAFSDSERSDPRLRPSECRILKTDISLAPSQNPVFSRLKPTGKYYYFYWMLNNSRDISWFRRKYNRTWDALYEELVKLLKNPIDQRVPMIQ